MPIHCFYLEPTSRMRASLHRWSRSACRSSRKLACQSRTPLTVAEGYYESDDTWPHDDPRWPTLCAECGKPFKEGDYWQLLHEPLFYWREEDVEVTINEAMPGALWDARQWATEGMNPGPDGLYLYVKLPNGKDWFIDGPARGVKDHATQSWTRTGDVPRITVTPGVVSVNDTGLVTRSWEGKIVNGVLQEKKST